MSFTSQLRQRIPLFALTVGAFGIGSTEFVIMGLLPEVAADLHVSIPSAGMLVTGYAMGVVVGAPLMAAALSRAPRKGMSMPRRVTSTSGNSGIRALWKRALQRLLAGGPDEVPTRPLQI